jgi:hypothetical protein
MEFSLNSDVPVAVVDGPNGEARVYEVYETDVENSTVAVLLPGADGKRRRTKLIYVVRFGGQVDAFATLGEAWVTAGALAGTKT